MKISPVRILIIDDDEDDFFIIKQYLDKIEGHECLVNWCPNYNEAGQIICRGEYDLYFVDYHLHAKTGLELIEESIKNNCEEPFILLTGNGSRAIDMMAMQDLAPWISCQHYHGIRREFGSLPWTAICHHRNEFLHGRMLHRFTIDGVSRTSELRWNLTGVYSERNDPRSVKLVGDALVELADSRFG